MKVSGQRRDANRRTVQIVGFSVLAIGLAFSAPAFAQSADLKPLIDRIQRLERDIHTLNTQGTRSGAPAELSSGGPAMAAGNGDVQPTIARMELRLTALETELREATGRAEEISYQLDQINQRLEKLIGDVDYRLNLLERGQADTQGRAQGDRGTPATAPSVAAVPPPPGVQRAGSGQGFATQPGTLGTLSGSEMARLQQQRGAAAPTTTAAAPALAAPAAPADTMAEQAAAAPGVLPEGTPEEQYSYAFGLLRQARYDEAEVALRAFVDAHADHKLAGNAKYWLGETFYVRAEYVQAAEVFLDAYQADQSGPKAPDTLLKLGMSLGNLDKKKEACAAFGKLAGEYPDAPSNVKRVVAREQQKYGCQ